MVSVVPLCTVRSRARLAYKECRIIISLLEKGRRTIDVVRRRKDLGQMVSRRKAAKKYSNVLTVCRRRGKGARICRKKGRIWFTLYHSLLADSWFLQS